MAIELNDNVEILAPKPSDPRYFDGSNTPWDSIGAVNAGIPSTKRHIGLTVSVVGVEYHYKDGIADGNLVLKTIDISGLAPKNNPVFTGSVVVPNATQNNQAVNLGQLDSVQITVGEEFYYDENNILRPNISTYRQVELNNTSPIPIITLDFEPTFIQSVNVNGIILTQNQYIYTAPDQLDLSDYVPSITPMTIEIIYDHFITNNEI